MHLLSRRNRGLSGNYPDHILDMEAVMPLFPKKAGEGGSPMFQAGVDIRTYNEDFSRSVLETDLADIDLVIEKTGSVFLLGVSVGAILGLAGLRSLKTLPSFSNIRKIIIFEPPMQFSDLDTGLNVQGTRKYENE